MSRVRPDDVRRVAALARLAVGDERIETLAAQLDAILGHMDVLRSVPLPSPDLDPPAPGTPLRDDVLAPRGLDRSPEHFAPLARDGFFLVPRLASHDPGEAGGA